MTFRPLRLDWFIFRILCVTRTVAHLLIQPFPDDSDFSGASIDKDVYKFIQF